MPVKRRKPAPAKRAAKKTTALAKRTPPKKTAKHTALMPAPKTETALAPGAPPAAPLVPWHERPLESGHISLGSFAIEDVKFTAEEEAVLGRSFAFTDLRVKPTGAVYVPHPVYTRRLIEAFGRTGWALRPLQTPVIGNGTVVTKFMLFVHGKAVAVADGEQEYFDGNKQQSYGDAIEACHSSALRRVCKHLGIGLELWDKSFNDAFLEEFCIQVYNEKRNSYEWRRKVDPPFWWEKGNKAQAQKRTNVEHGFAPPPDVERAAAHPFEDHPITDAQVRKLWGIIRRSGRTEFDVKDYLAQRFRIDSTKKILRKDFETICQALEAPGPLLAPGAVTDNDISWGGEREPGEDD